MQQRTLPLQVVLFLHVQPSPSAALTNHWCRFLPACRLSSHRLISRLRRPRPLPPSSFTAMEAVSHALAGAAGGVIAMALLYPLENVRTRLQVQIEQRKKQLTNGTTPASQPSTASVSLTTNGHSQHQPPSVNASRTIEHIESEDAVPHYSGTLDCIVRVCQREGWRALYSGLASALVGVGVSSAVYFFCQPTYSHPSLTGTKQVAERVVRSLIHSLCLFCIVGYHLLRSYLLKLRDRRSMGAVDNLLIAAVAGVLNILCTLPIWVVNTRMTLARKGSSSYSSITHTFRTIVAEEGVAGLYKGLVPSLILVSNPAIQFLAYEQLVVLLSRYYRARHRAATTVLSSISTTHANTPTTLPIPPTPLPASPLSTSSHWAL